MLHAIQVASDGDVRLVSGVGSYGTNYVSLTGSGKKSLCSSDVLRVAELLSAAQPKLLKFLNLRQLPFTFHVTRHTASYIK